MIGLLTRPIRLLLPSVPVVHRVSVEGEGRCECGADLGSARLLLWHIARENRP